MPLKRKNMTNFMEKEETMYHTIEVNVLKILGNNI